MKKILMTLAVAFIAIAANAQVYVGGNIGIGSSKMGNADNVTTYKFLPEVGYNINEDWAVGTTIGWGKGEGHAPTEIMSETNNYMTVAPYVRYTFVHNKYVNVFVDGGFGYYHINHAKSGAVSYNNWEAGIRPGVAVNLSPKLSFETHVGFAGWSSTKADVSGAKASNAWGVNLDGNNVTFGVYYNF